MTDCWTVVSNHLKLIHRSSVRGTILGVCFSDRWFLSYTNWLPVSVILPLPGIMIDCCWLSEVDCTKYLQISISKQLGRRPNHKRAEKEPCPSCLLCGGLCQAMPGFLLMTLGEGVGMDEVSLTAVRAEGKHLPQKQNKIKKQQKALTVNILFSLATREVSLLLPRARFCLFPLPF